MFWILGRRETDARSDWHVSTPRIQHLKLFSIWNHYPDSKFSSLWPLAITKRRNVNSATQTGKLDFFLQTNNPFQNVKCLWLFRYIFLHKCLWHHSGSHHNKATAIHLTVASVHYIWQQTQQNVTFWFHRISISQHCGWVENERQGERDTQKKNLLLFFFFFFYSGKQQKHPKSTTERKNLQPAGRR